VFVIAALSVAVLGLVFQSSTGGTSSDNWVDVLLKSGPWAIVVLLIIMDKLTTTGERDRLRLENTELRKTLQEAEIANRSMVIPALTESNRLLGLYRDPTGRGTGKGEPL
jgi:hypothetical protein